jgi:hypothetical protein
MSGIKPVWQGSATEARGGRSAKLNLEPGEIEITKIGGKILVHDKHRLTKSQQLVFLLMNIFFSKRKLLNVIFLVTSKSRVVRPLLTSIQDRITQMKRDKTPLGLGTENVHGHQELG